MKFSAALSAIFLSFALVACAHTPAKNPDQNHTHADFAVWIDGKQMDFSGPEYMAEDLTPAELEALKHGTGALTDFSLATLQQYLHLHDGNGHVIHRHKPGLTLKDFFTSIRVGFKGNCFTSGVPMQDGEVCGKVFRLFVNGTERPFDDLRYVFQDGDHLLITDAGQGIEAPNPEEKNELGLMTDDACLYSKTCPWRGEAPTENCIADPEVPCVQK